jgi:hypothetical protein
MTDVLKAELDGLRLYCDTRFAGSERALELATRELTTRLVGMNEFRDTLRDQAATFVTERDMVERTKAFDYRLQSLEVSRGKLIGIAMAVATGVSLITGILLKVGL